MFYDIIERKNAFLGYKNKKFKRSKNWHFYKGVNPWFWSKNGHFSNFYFLENTGQENVFYDILERKNALIGYKNKTFRNSKNWHFSNGVNPCCWSKTGHFSNFYFLGNNGQENVFYDILEPKRAFRGYKKKEVQTVEKLTFFPWFWSKNGHFTNFCFFRQYWPEKCLLWYSRTKNQVCRL